MTSVRLGMAQLIYFLSDFGRRTFLTTVCGLAVAALANHAVAEPTTSRFAEASPGNAIPVAFQPPAVPLRQPPSLGEPAVDDAIIAAEREAAADAAAAIDARDEPLNDPETDARRIYRPIGQVSVNTALPPGETPRAMERQEGDPPPVVMPLVGDQRLEGGWGDQMFNWSATQFCHQPLYFEEANLERYGYGCRPCLQPLVSGAHFFLTVPALPYKMVVNPPRECVYTLGYYRPGDRVPWQRNFLPWDTRAAVVEAGVAVGLVFLIP
jgi:hypothetical protein